MRNVLRSHEKMTSDSAETTSSGRLVVIRDAAAEKALPLTVDGLTVGATRRAKTT